MPEADKVEKDKAERKKKTGISVKTGTNMKASGSTPKVIAEEDNIQVESQLKRTRMAANSAGGSGSEVPSVAESLHCISEALTESPANEGAFIQPQEEGSGQELDIVPSPMVEEPEDKEDEVQEVHKEVEGPHKEDKKAHEVKDDKTMRDPEADEL
ncbi:hypothetical protein M422DRAFT_248390 [Sphaerobolus stellatus SS14]|uniref:Uncharacterized protein n=1 Tax=Sphaerobolus stellatus (strain SS14) TaxID=990650 RepID=A0A0C9UVY1_SPHS4|nr:hypothetical protein M422DRAFT_248390 [Sphaerobolus stellatus SS14]